MNKIKKIILCLCVCFLFIPSTLVYASDGIELYVYFPDVYEDSNKEEVVLLDNLADFFVSVCLYDCYETGFLSSEDDVFIFINMTSKYCYPTIHVYKTFGFRDDYLRATYSYRIYDTSTIFTENLSFQNRDSGSGGTSLFKSEDLKNVGNTSPFKYYCTKNYGTDYSFKSLPEPMPLEDSYHYYFGTNNNDISITFVDFTETNKILNNIFIIVVFAIIYGWFLNPLFKIFNNIIKGE